jgi:hypothetical protein
VKITVLGFFGVVDAGGCNSSYSALKQRCRRRLQIVAVGSLGCGFGFEAGIHRSHKFAGTGGFGFGFAFVLESVFEAAKRRNRKRSPLFAVAAGPEFAEYRHFEKYFGQSREPQQPLLVQQ